nr:hypothetical protein [Streptomyces decoyicus]
MVICGAVCRVDFGDTKRGNYLDRDELAEVEHAVTHYLGL